MEDPTQQFTERQKGIFKLFSDATQIEEYGDRLSIICVEWLAHHIQKELLKENMSCHVRDGAISGSGNDHSEIAIYDKKERIEPLIHRIITDIALRPELSKKAHF
jgi:hypothetical protein